jgi:pimeloyl-ACP methyl ester carboxylesterase
MPRTPARQGVRLTAVLAALAVAFGLLGLASAATAQPTRSAPAAAAPAAHAPVVGPARQHGAKPTVVLVHGAWADASSWTGVVTRLQRDGYRVLAPPNPLRSLPGDAAYLASFLATVPGPIVLVGHSYGGAVITNAATGNPNVKALVYVDAFAPAQGETVLSLAGPDSALAVDPATVFDLRPYPGGPPGDVDVYLKPAVVANSFAQDLPARTTAVMAATQRPSAFSSGLQPSGVPAYETIPSWYLVGTDDKVIPPAQQLFMARRAHAHIVEVRASHVSLISRPGAVERLVVAAARATS